MLLFYLSNANKNEIGWDYVEDRWGDRRFMQLIWGDRVLWEADMGPQRVTGEWVHVNLPVIPEQVNELSLRLRVEDRLNLNGNNNSIAFVGPLWLLERGVGVD